MRIENRRRVTRVLCACVALSALGLLTQGRGDPALSAGPVVPPRSEPAASPQPPVTSPSGASLVSPTAIPALVRLRATRPSAAPSPSRVAPPPPPVAAVRIAGCPANARTVPNDYLGLSIEWSSVQRWFGASRAGVVPSTVSLLQRLQPGPGPAGVLRIGGNSEDGYGWDATGNPDRNTAFSGTINRGMIDALFDVARRTGWKVILGANLRQDDPQQAVELVRYARSVDTGKRLLAVELGNEPNVYFGSDVHAYLERIGRYVAALDADPATAGVPITGPALSNNADPAFLTGLRDELGARMPFVTWHHYANQPTPALLLQPSVQADWARRIGEMAALAGTTPARMGEGNSVGGGGLNGVSNVMASSTWLADMLLSGAAAGLSGVNLHAWDAAPYPEERRKAWYTPFVVRDGQVSPRPSLYALALLRDLPGKRVCSTATTSVARGHTVRAWTLGDPTSGRLYVYLVHGPSAAAGPVTVTVPLRYRTGAVLSRITDPGGCLGKQTGIEGVSLPPNGRLSLPAVPITTQPGTSTYRFDLAPCSTALMQLPKR